MIVSLCRSLRWAGEWLLAAVLLLPLLAACVPLWAWDGAVYVWRDLAGGGE